MSAAPVRAQQLSITLVPATQSVPAGGSVLYQAQLVNSDPSHTLFLNGISFVLNGTAASFLTVDDSAFYSLAPSTLAAAGLPGAQYLGPLFGVSAATNTPLADYTGELSITGGANDTDGVVLRTASFSVHVTAASPEPSALCLLLVGVAGGGFVARCRRGYPTAV